MLELFKDNVHYWILPPTFPVSLFVDHFLIVKGCPTFREERMFPNNHGELFFNLGDIPQGVMNHSLETYVFKEVVVSGLRNTFFTIRPGTHFSVAGIRFKLFGFYNLFKIPAYEFSNHNFHAIDVWGNELRRIREKLLESTCVEQIYKTLSAWIQSKINLSHLQEAKFWEILEKRLKTIQPPVQINLAELMGYSHKHTIELFKEKAGLPPKMIQKIFRFDSILQILLTSPDIDWAGFSYAAGYTDQSHFIKEFKEFTGFTPREFITNKPKDFYLRQVNR